MKAKEDALDLEGGACAEVERESLEEDKTRQIGIRGGGLNHQKGKGRKLTSFRGSKNRCHGKVTITSI